MFRMILDSVIDNFLDSLREWIIAFATVGAVVVALFKDSISKRLYKPHIFLKVDNKNPYCSVIENRESSSAQQADTKSSELAKNNFKIILRLNAKNSGNYTAESFKLKLSKTTITHNAGRQAGQENAKEHFDTFIISNNTKKDENSFKLLQNEDMYIKFAEISLSQNSQLANAMDDPKSKNEEEKVKIILYAEHSYESADIIQYELVAGSLDLNMHLDVVLPNFSNTKYILNIKCTNITKQLLQSDTFFSTESIKFEIKKV